MAARVKHVSVSWSRFLEGSAAGIYHNLDQISNFQNFAVEVGTDNPSEQYIPSHKQTKADIKTELDAWTKTDSAKTFAIDLLYTESKPYRICHVRGQMNFDWDAYGHGLRTLSDLYMERCRQGTAVNIGFGHRRMPIGCGGSATNDSGCEEHENVQFDHWAEVRLAKFRS